MNIRVLQAQLRLVIPSSSPSIRKALQWLVEHLPEIAWNGIGTVSNLADVSPSTMVRAIQQTGFAGYSALQHKVRSIVPESSLAWKLFQERTTGTQNLVNDVIAREISHLELMEVSIAPVLDTLITRLLEAPNILIVAGLLTTAIAEHLTLHLRLLLGSVHFAEASSSEAWLRLRDIREGDVVLGVSYPRYAEATQWLLEKARRGTPHVLITDANGPELTAVSMTVRLPMVSHYHVDSSTALMVLIPILARGMVERDPDRILRNLHGADEIWRELTSYRTRPHRPNDHNALALGACRLINIKHGRIGGHFTAQRVHDVAQQANLPVWCGGMEETGIKPAHLHMSTLPNFLLPGDTSASSRYFARDLIGPPFALNPDGTINRPYRDWHRGRPRSEAFGQIAHLP